jgi:hypothetical protein
VDSKLMMRAQKGTLAGILAVAGCMIASVSCGGNKEPVRVVQTREATVAFNANNKAFDLLKHLDSVGARPTIQEIEAHGFGDDQKLSSSSDTDYGPMADVYPIPDLTKLTIDDYKVQTPFAVAIVVVAGNDAPNPNPMQLVPGNNCLYLRHSLRGPPRWIGYVNAAEPSIPEGPVNCDPSKAGHDLEVASHQMNGQSADQYAGVARFADDVHGNTIAGLRCADAWCEFGTNTVVPSQTAGAEPGATIKGWHDEQRLATSVNGKLTRSHILATIYPDKDFKPKDASDGSWHMVAHVKVKDPKSELAGSKYGLKWGLAEGDNDLEFQYTPATKAWDGRFTHKDKTTGKPVVTRIVVTHGDSNGDYPGVARWRWTDGDESGWIGCLDGCCLVDDYRIVMKSTTMAAANTTTKHD